MEHFQQRARDLDTKDPLAKYKREFYTKEGQYYLDGNSLGLASKRAERTLLQSLEDWKTFGIDGWHEGTQPWFYMSEMLGREMATLLGAHPNEVLATNSTTINIHQAVRTLYNPTPDRYKILADHLNFPSDIYALQSILEDHNTPDGLVQVASRDGHSLNIDDIIEQFDESIALALLPSVLYRSGQILDIETLSLKAHEKGIILGFDLCHSIGSVPHELSKHNVDFAVWCTYKHLNSGPGAVGGMFINKTHHHQHASLKGWFGNNKKTQFDMNHDFEAAPDISQYQVGTPHIFSMAPMIGALDMINEAGIHAIREKSLLLTAFMLEIVRTQLDLEIVSPTDDSRGGHILIKHTHAAGITKALKARGVVPDFRAPSYVRIAPVALYNSFTDVYEAMVILKEILEHKTYENYENTRGVIA